MQNKLKAKTFRSRGVLSTDQTAESENATQTLSYY
jgi:hypothetical protein